MIALPAKAEDASDLARVHAAAFADPWSAGEIAGLLRGVGGFGFTVRVDGDTVGFILCRTIADEAEVLTLATLPAGRRRGVGRTLLEAAAAHAQARGGVKMFLEVAEDNGPAIALYSRAGFERVGARAGYYSRPTGAITAIVMRRDLNT